MSAITCYIVRWAISNPILPRGSTKLLNYLTPDKALIPNLDYVQTTTRNTVKDNTKQTNRPNDAFAVAVKYKEAYATE